MTRKPTRISPPRRVSSAAQIHIPHSSWARVERSAPNASATIAPDDFWARLGL